MGESAPVGRFAAEKIGQAANAEIGIVVRNENRDFGARRQFLGAERRAYSGVAAAE